MCTEVVKVRIENELMTQIRRLSKEETRSIKDQFNYLLKKGLECAEQLKQPNV